MDEVTSIINFERNSTVNLDTLHGNICAILLEVEEAFQYTGQKAGKDYNFKDLMQSAMPLVNSVFIDSLKKGDSLYYCDRNSELKCEGPRVLAQVRSICKKCGYTEEKIQNELKSYK